MCTLKNFELEDSHGLKFKWIQPLTSKKKLKLIQINELFIVIIIFIFYLPYLGASLFALFFSNPIF